MPLGTRTQARGLLVEREGGLKPARAVIAGENEHRPHLVKVKYLDSRTGAWIARKRISEHADRKPASADPANAAYNRPPSRPTYR